MAVAVTDEPWRLGVDALVVPVGGQLGLLGAALHRHVPSFRTARVDLASIPASRPRIVQLDPDAPLRHVVLASPHGASGGVDPVSVGVATRSAVAAADRAGATSLALPLLATGALGIPHGTAAAVAVPAVVAALRSARTLELVVFVGMNPDLPDLIATHWDRPDVTTPADRAAAPDVDLAGGVTSDLVPSAPIPLERDRLGVGTYVSMLATVIAQRATPTPLSIGVFGEWGSGKSFFMGMLRGRVDELAGSGSPEYCHRVVQIGFNAWHYVDTDLWVSLAEVIFRALAEPDRGPEPQRSELQRVLAGKVGERAGLDDHAREVARLKAEVDRTDGEHVARTRDLVAALRSSPAARRLERAGRRVGVTDDVARARLLSRELRGLRPDADTVRGLPAHRAGQAALVTAAAVLCACAATAVAAPLVSWLGALVGAGLGVVGGGLLLRARAGVDDLRALADDLRTGADRSGGPGGARAADDPRTRANRAAGPGGEHLADDPRTRVDRAGGRVADAVAVLREAEAAHLVARARLDRAVARGGAPGRASAEADPSRRMSAFLRAHGDARAPRPGVISALREDFEHLVALLAHWRANPDADPDRRPVDRVVLHIDDLDRCEPAQVVQVLEAVHLLLALDLFVVVVGVDPRWLLGSVRAHYTGLLDHADASAPPAIPPEDYLEKIINIPFALPRMGAGSLGSVLRSMTDAERPPTTEPPTTEPPTAEARRHHHAADLTIEPGAPLADLGRPAPARPLTPGELDFLDALEPLVDTPRAAKRLFNVYRMIRATRDLSAAARFLGDEDRPGEFQAVVVLLGVVAGAPALAPAVLGAPRGSGTRGGLIHRDPAESWSTFVADLFPREGRSPVTGAVTAAEADSWLRLYQGLQPITRKVTLPDLTAFRTWTPHVRRFSYTNR
ncbi:KAP-like P-loop domain-containing protein [Saccharothrix australiensis]|uniref:KAP-like P-loop domain-containing protein n=1 Tax=Saccharothrix australiensis TaxID=2072 RepID=A0A495W150_9PSEU|nr:KAP-like P-loop domain-containing protein [Saccharothrix australiensis]